MNTAFWTIMHDAGIDAITGCIPGDIVLTIGIEYICDHLPTTAKTLRATFRGCTLFTYTPYGQAPVIDLQKIAIHDIEILSAVDEDGRIVVCCANGTLEAAYGAVEVRLMEGTVVSQSELEAAANRSVVLWLARKPRKDRGTAEGSA